MVGWRQVRGAPETVCSEAGGDLTGDRDLKNEGKVDQASGTVKDKVGDAADAAKGVVGKD